MLLSVENHNISSVGVPKSPVNLKVLSFLSRSQLNDCAYVHDIVLNHRTTFRILRAIVMLEARHRGRLEEEVGFWGIMDHDSWWVPDADFFSFWYMVRHAIAERQYEESRRG